MLFCEIGLYTHLINPSPAISRWGILFVRFHVSGGMLISIHTLEIPVLILNIECANLLSIGTPISTLAGRQRVSINQLCQSPICRDTHFYCGYHLNIDASIPVSIPYLSGHPFLPPLYGVWALTPKTMCQSPIYRDTHFYHRKDLAIAVQKVDCVNPLSIGTPISTRKEE